MLAVDQPGDGCETHARRRLRLPPHRRRGALHLGGQRRPAAPQRVRDTLGGLQRAHLVELRVGAARVGAAVAQQLPPLELLLARHRLLRRRARAPLVRLQRLQVLLVPAVLLLAALAARAVELALRRALFALQRVQLADA